MQRIVNNHRAGKIRRSINKIKSSTYTRSAVTVVSIRRYQRYRFPPTWKKKGAWHTTKTWWVPQKHRPLLNQRFPPSVTRRLGVRTLSHCRRLQISITHPKQNWNLWTCLWENGCGIPVNTIHFFMPTRFVIGWQIKYQPKEAAAWTRLNFQPEPPVTTNPINFREATRKVSLECNCNTVVISLTHRNKSESAVTRQTKIHR